MFIMKSIRFTITLFFMCLCICFGNAAYAAQVQKTNDDITVGLGKKPNDDKDRSGYVLFATGQVYSNPLRLVLSLPELLGETTVTIKDSQTHATVGSTTVNATQEPSVTLNLTSGSGHYQLVIESAEYAGEGTFTL